MNSPQTTLRAVLGAALAAATVAGCAVKLNGKTYGGGTGGTTVGGGDGAVTTPGDTAAVTTPGGDRDAETKLPRDVAREASVVRPPPAKPADPWSAVAGGLPRRSAQPAFYFVSSTVHDCSAAHDHCLPADIWFVEDGGKTAGVDREVKPKTYVGLDPADPSDDDPWLPYGDSGYHTGEAVAHRTVPATKRHLVKGAFAMAQPAVEFAPYKPEGARKAPNSEIDAVPNWHGGTVESVDWNAGKVRFVGHSQYYWISATRVAVLTYRPGGQVEIRGKLGKDELAATVSEVVLPRADTGTTAAPWAEVGADGQPKEPTDQAALETMRTVTCDAAHDHCLRPWVWFVEDNRGAWPSRFRAGAFHAAFFPDAQGKATKGYRSVPADPATLKVGTHVFFRDQLPDHEGDAADKWRSGDVAEVQVDDGVFKVNGDDNPHRLAAARVAVVWWFPGEKAEKVE